MGQTMVNFRVDTKLKKQMEEVCDSIGISMSSAFKLFAKEVVKDKMIPFLLAKEDAYIDPIKLTKFFVSLPKKIVKGKKVKNR